MYSLDYSKPSLTLPNYTTIRDDMREKLCNVTSQGRLCYGFSPYPNHILYNELGFPPLLETFQVLLNIYAKAFLL